MQAPAVLEDGGEGVAAGADQSVAANNPPRAPLGYGAHQYAVGDEASGQLGSNLPLPPPA